jgi:hypothetical protein
MFPDDKEHSSCDLQAMRPVQVTVLQSAVRTKEITWFQRRMAEAMAHSPEHHVLAVVGGSGAEVELMIHFICNNDLFGLQPRKE